MKGLAPLFFGLFAIFAFSWLGLIVVPNAQIGHLDPETNPQDETDRYPLPPSGMAVRGREVYVSNGCVYCHSEQVRPDYISADVDRKWGERRSAPRDYVFARPVVLGAMRIGPDLSNIGKRAPNEEAAAAQNSPSPAAQTPTAGSTSVPAPAAAQPNQSPSPAVSADAAVAANDDAPYSAAWHHKHLYDPRSLNPDSIMPAYRFLYEKRRISGERSADALKLEARDSLPENYEAVPTYDAKCLVAYLMSLDQSHPLTEVKASAAPAASPAAAGKESAK